MKTLTKAYMYKGQTFAIVENNDGIVCAINHKYLDSNGKLTTTLNGIQMYVDMYENTLEGVIKRIQLRIDVDEYIKQHNIDKSDGLALAKAIHEVYKNR